MMRAETLRRMAAYREEFVDFANAIKSAHGCRQDAERDLERIMSAAWSCWSYESLESLRAHYGGS